MPTCAFPGCSNPCRASELGETKIFKGECPTERREVIRCWKPAVSHYKYCHYHRMLLRGECEPSVATAYSPELQQRMIAARKKFNQQFQDKKEREAKYV